MFSASILVVMVTTTWLLVLFAGIFIALKNYVQIWRHTRQLLEERTRDELKWMALRAGQCATDVMMCLAIGLLIITPLAPAMVAASRENYALNGPTSSPNSGGVLYTIDLCTLLHMAILVMWAKLLVKFRHRYLTNLNSSIRECEKRDSFCSRVAANLRNCSKSAIFWMYMVHVAFLIVDLCFGPNSPKIEHIKVFEIHSDMVIDLQPTRTTYTLFLIAVCFIITASIAVATEKIRQRLAAGVQDKLYMTLPDKLQEFISSDGCQKQVQNPTSHTNKVSFPSDGTSWQQLWLNFVLPWIIQIGAVFLSYAHTENILVANITWYLTHTCVICSAALVVGHKRSVDKNGQFRKIEGDIPLDL